MVKQFINRAEAIAWMSLVMMSDASRRNTLRYCALRDAWMSLVMMNDASRRNMLRYCALRDYHAIIAVWIVSK
jgi:hypothetical protein